MAASTSRPPRNQSTQRTRSRMPALFTTVRASLYASVLLFTGICLAMAGTFSGKLAASDLTRFVPFAIFVCAASLFIFVVLLAFSYLLRERNPISTRIELASLGLAGIFWLVLGVYLTTSESQNADVECYAAPDSQVVLDPEIASFQTEQYQAMYRVLNAFSLMNAVLVIFACLALLFLALRRHRMGDEHMWYGPVTACAWFNTYNNTKQGHKAQSSSTSVLPIVGTTAVPARVANPPSRSKSTKREYNSEKRTSPVVPPPPPKKPERHASARSGQSGRSKSTSAGRSLMSEIENGLMRHPKNKW